MAENWRWKLEQIKIKYDFFLVTEDTIRKGNFLNNRKKLFLWKISFKTQFKIEFLGPFTEPRNPLKKTLLRYVPTRISFLKMQRVSFDVIRITYMNQVKIIIWVSHCLPGSYIAWLAWWLKNGKIIGMWLKPNAKIRTFK